MIPVFLLLGLFNLNLGAGELGPYILYGVAALIVYFIGSKYLAGESLAEGAAALPSRLANLLTHVESLGLPLLKPLLKDAAAGKWASIPGQVDKVLDSLDDKASREGILTTLFWSRVDHWISDNDRAKELLDYLAKKLGVTITNPPAP